MDEKPKLKKYSKTTKLQALNWQIKNNKTNAETAKKYNVNIATFRTWKSKHINELENVEFSTDLVVRSNNSIELRKAQFQIRTYDTLHNLFDATLAKAWTLLPSCDNITQLASLMNSITRIYTMLAEIKDDKEILQDKSKFHSFVEEANRVFEEKRRHIQDAVIIE